MKQTGYKKIALLGITLAVIAGSFVYIYPTKAIAEVDQAHVIRFFNNPASPDSLETEIRSLPEEEQIFIQEELKRRALLSPDSITDNQRRWVEFFGRGLKLPDPSPLSSASKQKVINALNTLQSEGAQSPNAIKASQALTSEEKLLFRQLGGIESLQAGQNTASDKAIIDTAVDAGSTLSAQQILENDRAAKAKAAAEAAAQAKRVAAGECSLNPIYFDLGNCIKFGLAWVGTLMVYFYGLLLWLAAQVFDLAIKISIVDFKKFADMPAILAVWKIGRDLSNMFFIFLVLTSALGTIFNLQKINLSQNLTKILIVALFINFSFPISRVIIDTTNIAALEFYDAIKPRDKNVAFFVVDQLAPISGAFDAGVLAQLKTAPGSRTPPIAPESLDLLSIAAKTYGAAAVILATALTFAAGAVLFLIRSVTLLYLIALSSLAFLCSLLPRGASKYYDMWWNKLIDNSLFAPIYLFLIYFVFKIIGSKDGLATSMGVGSGQGIIDQPIQVAIYYGFLLFLMNGALYIANELSIEGAKTIEGYANTARNYINPSVPSKFVAGEVGNSLGRRFITPLASNSYVQAGAKRLAEYSPRMGAPILRTLDTVKKESFGQKAITDEAKFVAGEIGEKKDQIRFIAGLDAKTGKQVFKDTSDREKIALLQAAKKRVDDTTAGTPERAQAEKELEALQKLREGYEESDEKREALRKTEEEAEKANKKKEVREEFEKIAKKIASTPGYTLNPDEIKALQRAPKDLIANLSTEARKNASVIGNLKGDQFKKLIADGDLQTDEITEIKKILGNLGFSHPIGKLQTNPAVKENLGI